MNRADKIYIVMTLLLGIALFFTPRLWQSSDGEKYAVVKKNDKEILRLDLSKNQTVTVEGSLGPVVIEIKDNAIRVEKENSPYHYCSLQGWVKYTNTAITCLPNSIVIHIFGGTSTGSDTIVQ